ncbi:ribosomal RNA-processing protein 7-domain-containing protein [Pisolithus marmoratus]|nr:ribosomal RNA-processing protein 7-domain-containing protein [Pisolithus marmoratus]
MSGFTVIPVTYPHLTHTLYAKAHASSSNSTKLTFPLNRILFLINIPIDATECKLSLFFRYICWYGRAELQGDTLGSGSGSEEDSDGPDSSMEVDTKDKKRDEPAPHAVVPLPTNPHHTLCKMGAVTHLAHSWPSSEEPRGLAHYCEAIVDEHGFTLATCGGAYGKMLGGGIAIASKQFQATSKTGSKKKKEPKEKTSFYAFQKVEKQRQAIVDLKKNFEVDKAQIEKLKQSHHFKLY